MYRMTSSLKSPQLLAIHYASDLKKKGGGGLTMNLGPVQHD